MRQDEMDLLRRRRRSRRRSTLLLLLLPLKSIGRWSSHQVDRTSGRPHVAQISLHTPDLLVSGFLWFQANLTTTTTSNTD